MIHCARFTSSLTTTGDACKKAQRYIVSAELNLRTGGIGLWPAAIGNSGQGAATGTAPWGTPGSE